MREEEGVGLTLSELIRRHIEKREQEILARHEERGKAIREAFFKGDEDRLRELHVEFCRISGREELLTAYLTAVHQRLAEWQALPDLPHLSPGNGCVDIPPDVLPYYERLAQAVLKYVRKDSDDAFPVMLLCTLFYLIEERAARHYGTRLEATYEDLKARVRALEER